MEITIKEEKIEDSAISLENYHMKSGAIFYVKPNNDFLLFCTLCQNKKYENFENLRNHLENCSMNSLHTSNYTTKSETITKSTNNGHDNLSSIGLIKEDGNVNNIKCGEVYYSKCSKLVALECSLCKTQAFTTFDEFSIHSLIHLQHDTETEIENKTETVECSSIKRHYKVQTMKKSYKCEECLKCFTTSSSLKIHMRRHTGEKLFQCEECLKFYTSSSDLKVHMRKHTGEKPFKCEECLKCFASSGNFKKHMRRHRGEKPFKCEECSKCYISSSELKLHIRRHTGEKPFKCEECLKCYISFTELKLHMRRHSGEKPFKCEECLKYYTTSKVLKLHMRRHTTRKNLKWEECSKCFTSSSVILKTNCEHTQEKNLTNVKT